MSDSKRKTQELDKASDSLVVGAVGAGALFTLMAAGLGGLIGHSKLRVNHQLNLPPAVDAERRTFTGRSGLISYYFDTKASGRPLVLVHSVNAAASAYEMRPLFNYFRSERPVYVLDMPGFGFSERSNRDYTPRLFVDAIIDLIDSQIGQQQPVDVIALSLGSEFAARAAVERPDLINSLVLISPSGLRLGNTTTGTYKNDFAYKTLTTPLWSQALYDGLVSRPSIKFFLEKSFEGPVDPGMLRYDYLTAHQPGARYAPLSFVGGKLFSRDSLTIYRNAPCPVLVIYDVDPFVTFEALPFLLKNHPNWRAHRITPTKGLPHFERLDETARVVEQFWHSL